MLWGKGAMKGRGKGDTSTRVSNNAFRESYDRVFGKNVITTTKPVSPELVCPECGHYPLKMKGAMRERIAECPMCIFTEGF